MTFDDVGSGGKGDKGRRTILAAAVEEDLGRVLVKCRRGLPGTATAGSDEKSLRCTSTPKLGFGLLLAIVLRHSHGCSPPPCSSTSQTAAIMVGRRGSRAVGAIRNPKSAHCVIRSTLGTVGDRWGMILRQTLSAYTSKLAVSR
jgi:hypothetical protein